MEINNFDVVRNLLEFQGKDIFYFCQVISRKKDGNDAGKKVIASINISSLQDYDRVKDDIITYCKSFNSRAYIKINPRNVKKITEECLREYSNICIERRYNLKSVWNKCCGKFSAPGVRKKFMIDIDYNKEYSPNVDQILNDLTDKCKPYGIDKKLCILPTPNGVHIITNPFNVKEFSKCHPEIPINENNCRDNMTLLYYYNDEN